MIAMRFIIVGLLVLLSYWCVAQSQLPKIELRKLGGGIVSTKEFAKNRATVIVFMNPECPITQQYIPLLARLHQQQEPSGIGFYGVFPTSIYEEKELKRFQQTYPVSFPLLIDTRKGKCTRWLQATVTPEVFVLDSAGQIRYQGAIDNQFYALGKRRAEVTDHYLTDALDALVHQSEVRVKQTQPLGCLIEAKYR